MNGTKTGQGRRGITFAARARLVVALALTGCLGDCNDPLSESARRGDPQVLATVTYDTAYGRAVPAVVYRDSLQTVRILADTIRLSPAKFTYRRRTIYGVSIGAGGEARQVTSPEWVTRAMYEVNDAIERYIVLDSFAIAPGLPPGSANWDSNGGTVSTVSVRRKVYLGTSPDSLYQESTRAYSGVFVPAR